MNRIILFAALIILASCDPKRVYENTIDLNQGYWHADSAFTFQIPVEEEGDFRLYMDIRNTSAYEYYNLYINYSLKKDGAMISTQMKELILFDPKTGKPKGSGLGDIVDSRLPLVDSLHLLPGIHEFKVLQNMRKDSLMELRSVGVRLERL